MRAFILICSAVFNEDIFRAIIGLFGLVWAIDFKNIFAFKSNIL